MNSFYLWINQSSVNSRKPKSNPPPDTLTQFFKDRFLMHLGELAIVLLFQCLLCLHVTPEEELFLTLAVILMLERSEASQMVMDKNLN